MTTETNGEREAPPKTVSDTDFEGWLSCHEPNRNQGRVVVYSKQDMRESYWAGFNECAAIATHATLASRPVEPQAVALNDERRYDLFEDVIVKIRFENLTKAEQHAQLEKVLAAASPQPGAETEAVDVLRELLAVKALSRERAKADWKAKKTLADEDYEAADRLSLECHRREKAAWETAADIVASSPTPAVSQGLSDEARDALQRDILNLPCRVPSEQASEAQVAAYKLGHRDARHAAIEVVLAAGRPR